MHAKKSHNIYYRLPVIVINTVLCLFFTNCKKWAEVGAPITNPSAATIYTNDAKAAAVLTGIYGKMSENATGFAQGRQSIGISAGLSADELKTYASVGVYHNTLYLNSRDVNVTFIWRDLYKYIYVANAALEGIANSPAVTDNVRNQLNGEAKFIRAFMHFYLVNLFGDVPLIMTTNYETNLLAGRTPMAEVYNQVIKDLEDARTLLPNDFVTPLGAVTNERVRPNSVAAAALLARVYLYLKDYVKAEALATEVIDNSNYSLLATLNNVFLMNSQEALWQIPPVGNSVNTQEGNALFKTSSPNTLEPVSLSTTLVNAFEAGDNRKTSWVDSITVAAVKYYFPKKYKVKGGTSGTPVSEYFMMMRYAEQFLIRAEARAKQGKLVGANSAESDINAIRSRAGLLPTAAATEMELLAAIEQERRIELFTEWGHRWLDLGRTNRLDDVMSVETPLKGGTWDPNMKLYPIPKLELDKAPNLQPQNPGYN